MNTLFRCIFGLTLPAALLGAIVVVAAPSGALASPHSAPPKAPFVVPPPDLKGIGIRENPNLDRGVSPTAPPFASPPPFPGRGHS